MEELGSDFATDVHRVAGLQAVRVVLDHLPLFCLNVNMPSAKVLLDKGPVEIGVL